MKKCFVKKLAFNITALFVLLLAMTSWSFAVPTIQYKDSSEGRIESVHVEKSSVKGRIFRVTPYHTTPGAHVHVSLLDAQGKVIATAMDRLPILMPKDDAHQRHSPYQVNFDGNTLTSHSIQVIYVAKSHSLCQ